MNGSTASDAPAIFRFAGCELDVAARELRRDGELVTVQPKVFELISYLLEHRDRAVDKGELQDAVWPGVVVTEMSLTQAVRKARVALGDDANLQTIIRTVHGHGYRFVAPVEPPVAPAAEPAREEAAPGAMEPGPGRRRALNLDRRWVTGGALLAAALLAYLLLRPGAPDPGTVRVAVLPVANATGQPELDWMELGLMGLASSLIDSAGRIAVVGDADVLQLARRADGAAPARLLISLRSTFGASHVLAARVERSAGLFRLSWELFDAGGEIRQGTSVGEDVTVLMQGAVQDVIARFGGPKRLPLEPTLISDDPFVNEAFARGMAFAIEGRCGEARTLFSAATSQAPRLFEPRYESASCARVLGQWKEAEEILSGLIAEQSAGGRTRALARSLLTLGVVHIRTGRLEEAAPLLEQALAAADAVGDHDLLADVLVNQAITAKNQSDFERSIALLERAHEHYALAGREIIPGSLFSGLANAAMEQGRLDDADGWLEAAIRSFRAVGDRRREAMMLNNRGYLRRLQGRLDEAEALHLESARIREELGDPVGVGRVHNFLAVVYTDRGRFTDAISSATIALRSAGQAGDALYVATAHAQLGDANLGLGRLDEAQAHFRDALDRFRELGDRQRTLEAELKLAAVAKARGRLEMAAQTTTQVLDAARTQGLAVVEIEALLQRGDIAAMLDEHARAREAWMTGLARAREVGQTGEETRLAIALAGLYLDSGEPGEAEPLMALLADRPDSGELLKLRARHAWARGDAPAAAAFMLRARELSGARWTETDERLLLDYRG